MLETVRCGLARTCPNLPPETPNLARKPLILLARTSARISPRTITRTRPNLAAKCLIPLARTMPEPARSFGWLAGAEPLPKGRGFRHGPANWAREASR